MITMRSTPPAKVGKPPPPVPPRPSKTLVQEAMAKTRKSPNDLQKSSPVRSAPPPPPLSSLPPSIHDISKSQSVVSVNVLVQKPVPLERSISEDVKCSTRTVVFQSPKIEASNTVTTNTKVMEIKTIDANESTKIKLSQSESNGIKKVDSFRVVAKKLERIDSVKRSDEEQKTKISRVKSMKEDEENQDEDSDWDQLLNDRNHVNTLIDEMFASVLEVSSSSGEEDNNKVTINTVAESNDAPTTVVIIDNKDNSCSSNSSTSDKKKVQFVDDRMNHELLISELESMRIEDEKISKRQRLPSKELPENGDVTKSDSVVDVSKIHHSDWVEVSDGQEVRLTSCQITIDDKMNNNNETEGEEEDNNNDSCRSKLKLDYERIKTMSSLNGLPPLPKSLSGFNLLDGQAKPPTPMRTTSMRGGQAPSSNNPSSNNHLVHPLHNNGKVNGVDVPATGQQGGRKSTTNLDAQLAILRREMYSLRQLDLSLLSQLWTLNESIQDFRQMLQDQEDRVLSPPSPSPAPSSGDEADADEFYMSASSMNFRTPPPPPPVRRPSSSSNASSLG